MNRDDVVEMCVALGALGLMILSLWLFFSLAAPQG
mgnify:CR=1 FL=1